MPVPEDLKKKPPMSDEGEETGTQTAPPPPQRSQAPPPDEEMGDESGGEWEEGEEYPDEGDDYPPEGEEDYPPEEGDMGEEMAPEGEQEPPEKYSAQVLRRVHHDSMILLQDYDEMRQFLEHEEVDGFLEKKLQTIVSDLEEIEELFAKHHPEAAPLEGGKDWDSEGEMGEEEIPEGEEENPEQDWEETPEGDEMEEGEEEPPMMGEGEEENPDEHEVENEADSREEEEPTDDEVAEEMTRSPKQGRKSLPRRRVKSNVPGYEEDQDKPGFPHSDATLPGEPGDEEQNPHSGSPTSSLAPSSDVGNEEHQDKPGTQGDDQEFASLLTQPMHMDTVKDTQSFLTQVGEMETVAWGEDGRKNAHHFAKALDAISRMGVGATGEKAIGCGKDPLRGVPKGPKEPVSKGKDPLRAVPKTTGGMRGKVKACSDFLHQLSSEKAIGDTHRQKALEHLKELDFMGGQDKEAGDEVSQSQSPEEVGDIGQKNQNPPLGRPDRPSRDEWEEPPSDEDVVNDVDQAMEQGRYVRPDHVVNSPKKGKGLRGREKGFVTHSPTHHTWDAPGGHRYEIDNGTLTHHAPNGYVTDLGGGLRRKLEAMAEDHHRDLMNREQQRMPEPDHVVTHREKRLVPCRGQKALPPTSDPLSQVAKTVAARGKQLESLTKQLNGLVNLT